MTPSSLRPRRRTVAALVAAFSFASVTLTAPARGEQDRVSFHPIDQAIPRAVEQEKVAVVYFTADWCGWCRKMESTTFPEPAVRSLSDAFVFAEVDADAQAHIAAMFGVRGLPALRFLNVSGELLEQVDGYVPPTRFAELLREHRGGATRPGAARQRFAAVLRVIRDLERAAAQEQVRDAVTRAVTLLAETDVFGRTGAEQAVVEMGPTAWPTLVELLEHERLAIRAAAAGLLRASTHRDISFDPFASPELRERQASAWRAWVQQNHENRGDRGATPDAVENDAAESQRESSQDADG